MKTLIVLLGIFSTIITHAEPVKEWCNYQLHGKTEAIFFKAFGDEREIIQIRFKGPIADRYLSLTKVEENQTFIYSQFATRDNVQALLKFKNQPKTIFKIVMVKGGNHYYYDDGEGDLKVDCPDHRFPESKKK